MGVTHSLIQKTPEVAEGGFDRKTFSAKVRRPQVSPCVNRGTSPTWNKIHLWRQHRVGANFRRQVYEDDLTSEGHSLTVSSCASVGNWTSSEDESPDPLPNVYELW